MGPLPASARAVFGKACYANLKKLRVSSIDAGRRLCSDEPPRCRGAFPNVFARINFLLGLGLLIQIVFYFAGVYLLVLPLSAIAPAWVRPAAGLAILAAVGVTVQLLSMAMGSLRGVALYATGERPMMPTFVSQSVIIIGHLGAIYAASGLLAGGEPIAETKLLLVAALYAAGVALGIYEWRQRKLARNGLIPPAI
jgi:hypothetical protein